MKIRAVSLGVLNAAEIRIIEQRVSSLAVDLADHKTRLYVNSNYVENLRNLLDLNKTMLMSASKGREIIFVPRSRYLDLDHYANFISNRLRDRR